MHWSLPDLPEQSEFTDRGRDEVYWELEKYVRLASKANPNVLETLWTPLVLDGELQQAFDETLLPEQPDFAQVNGFLIRARRRMVDA